MKKLLIALLLLSGNASADEWLEAPNQLGGKLLLLKAKCSSKPDETGRLILGTGGNGKNIRGCWYFFSDMIHVVWDDGTTYSYPKDMFVYRSDK